MLRTRALAAYADALKNGDITGLEGSMVSHLLLAPTGNTTGGETP
jgi:hypothetical protein